jgi:glycosyltransferase involved in cell wall biosynthesis
VSVIIPTRNSGGIIEKCLKAVTAQTYVNIETIVVDSGSDGTAEIARELGCKVIRAAAHMTKARNIGTKNSGGEFLFHLDSDIQLSQDTISDCVALCRKGADAVYVPQIFRGERFWGKCKGAEIELYIGNNELRIVRFMRRDALNAIGGYDESLISGEDWDTTQRLEQGHFNIATSNSIMVHGEGPVYLQRLVRKSFQYGKTVGTYFHKYPVITLSQWGPMRILTVLRLGVRRTPKYVVGILFLKSLEFGSGFIGIVANYLSPGEEITVPPSSGNSNSDTE